MSTQLEEQLVEALINLLAVDMGVGGTKPDAQRMAIEAIRAAGREPRTDGGTLHLIDQFMGVDDQTLQMHKADGDTAKIVRGKQLVALVIRSGTGRWTLCDANRHPLHKVEYNSPKKAFATFEEKFA